MEKRIGNWDVMIEDQTEGRFELRWLLLACYKLLVVVTYTTSSNALSKEWWTLFAMWKRFNVNLVYSCQWTRIKACKTATHHSSLGPLECSKKRGSIWPANKWILCWGNFILVNIIIHVVDVHSYGRLVHVQVACLVDCPATKRALCCH